MATLFVSYLEKRYNARLFSCSTLFVLIFFLLAIVIPYIVAYVTGCKTTFTQRVHRLLEEAKFLLRAALGQVPQ
jgi:predicted PurR-regulated permease PerM